jgi:hypothetical protein
MNKFTEIQRFDQWWLKVILALPLFESLAFILNDYQSTGDVSTNSLVGFASIALATILIVGVIKFTTTIDETGISFQFFPFHLTIRTIVWSDLDAAFVRDYSPLKEYGGWGIRHSLKNGKAYNIKGKAGLQLELKSGKKILIGTADGQKLINYLQDLKTRYHITAIK